MLSVELWHLLLLLRPSPVLILGDWIKKTSTLCAAASMLMHLSKMAKWDAVVLSFFFTICRSCDYFISVSYTGDSRWQREASERRKSHHFQQGRWVLLLSLSSPSHLWMRLRDNVFLTIWGMNIRDIEHFIRVFTDYEFCWSKLPKMYINVEKDDWCLAVLSHSAKTV